MRLIILVTAAVMALTGGEKDKPMTTQKMTEIRFSGTVDGVNIPAVLTKPEHAVAALLLIPGSLNSDVDGNYAPMFPGQPATAPHAYKDLAEQLTTAGIMVLRFAKTGPGTGSTVVDKELAAKKYKLFTQRVRVAEVFWAALREQAGALPCFLAGHSEGAVVGALVAQKELDVRGVIMLSGPSRPLMHMMAWQQLESDRREGKMTVERERQYAAAIAMLHDFAAGRPVPADGGANPYAAMLSFSARPENAPYLRSLEAVDPTAEFAKVAQPALIVQGGRDASVAAANAEELHRAKPDAKVEIFPELQHFYKRVSPGLPPQESFGQTSESDPSVSRAVAAWITALLQPK